MRGGIGLSSVALLLALAALLVLAPPLAGAAAVASSPSPRHRHKQQQQQQQQRKQQQQQPQFRAFITYFHGEHLAWLRLNTFQQHWWRDKFQGSAVEGHALKLSCKVGISEVGWFH